MAEKMKAVVKTRPELGGERLEVTSPIAPDQVIVKVRATSICGTDVHIYKWDDWAANRIGDKACPRPWATKWPAKSWKSAAMSNGSRWATTFPPRPTSTTPAT